MALGRVLSSYKKNTIAGNRDASMRLGYPYFVGLQTTQCNIPATSPATPALCRQSRRVRVFQSNRLLLTFTPVCNTT
jgi:hypothetical protein